MASRHIEVSWKQRVGGAVWIFVTAALWFGACTTRDAYSMPFFELALPALISLMVGTFVPGAQDWLPWGRAWKRFQERRVRDGIAEMEKDFEDGERVVIAGEWRALHRANTTATAAPRPPAQ